jgi:hypothetical protein
LTAGVKAVGIGSIVVIVGVVGVVGVVVVDPGVELASPEGTGHSERASVFWS